MKKWEISNLGSYSWVFGPQLRTIPILNDILTKAEGAINGADKDPEDPREVKYIYQNFETCKAA